MVTEPFIWYFVSTKDIAQLVQCNVRAMKSTWKDPLEASRIEDEIPNDTSGVNEEEQINAWKRFSISYWPTLFEEIFRSPNIIPRDVYSIFIIETIIKLHLVNPS